ncbi:MAG: filamentous hemagglutinin N-terminal domain-containing protein [Desulfobacterales bacterium]|nr:filamentous hemagglutinin N-terminal domain-containing protein [Desulfobacterales bacterium]
MKHTLQAMIILYLLAITIIPVHADEVHPRGITLDGTLGTTGNLNLPGPDYNIKAEYGRQAGANLFHSFQRFNIHSDESATFNGPDSVQNIISRVTGGDASWIDGKLRSAIPNADLYMLNPAGMMFGPNASLDMGGSFHVSTANYLRLGNNEKFYSMPNESDVLSVMAPTAFGFLDNDAAPISFEGGKITAGIEGDQFGGLTVQDGKTISVVGGNIEIRGIYSEKPILDENGDPVYEQEIDEWGYPAYVIETDENGDPVYDGKWPVYALDDEGNFIPLYVLDDEGNPIPAVETTHLTNLRAPGGQISIITGDWNLETGNPEPESPFSRYGFQVSISDKALVDVSGDRGGSIFIRSGQFVAKDSNIHARTLGDKDGGVVDIRADTISLTDSAGIYGNTLGTGNAPDIQISATESFTISRGNSEAEEESGIWSGSGNRNESGIDLGDAGNVLIEAKHIELKDDASIYTNTYGEGKGGDVTLRASESVSFGWNYVLNEYIPTIETATHSEEEAAGDSGNVLIQADNISFINTGIDTDYANTIIDTGTYGSGNGGYVNIRAFKSAVLTGGDIQNVASGTGHLGYILIEADNISFTDFGLNLATYDSGNGGDVTVRASDSIALSGASFYMRTQGSGDSGDLLIEANNITFSDDCDIQSSTYDTGRSGNVTFRASETVTFAGGGIDIAAFERHLEDAGRGGSLLIEADNIILKDHVQFVGSTFGPGKAGNITLRANEQLSLTESAKIYARVGGGEEFGRSSENFCETCTGKGGDVVMEAGDILVTGGAKIASSTFGTGNAGNIHIRAARTVAIDGTDSEGNASEISSGSVSSMLEEAGNGGIINVTTEKLTLSNSGRISTSSTGGGDAGRIYLNTGSLEISTGSTISSGSESVNFYRTDNLADRDSHFVLAGDIVETTDQESGLKEYRIWAGGEWNEDFPQNYTVDDLTELESLAEKYVLSQGDMATVSDASEGQPAKYFYTERREWIRADSLYTAAEMPEREYGSSESPVIEEKAIASALNVPEGTLGEGDVVVIANEGNKEYIIYRVSSGNVSFTMLNRSVAADVSELNVLSDHMSQGDVADVTDAGNGVPSRFVYTGEEWFNFGTVHAVNSLDDAAVPEKGSVLHVNNAGDGQPARFIYAENEWVKLGTVHLPVADIAGRDALSAQNGDMIQVDDAGNGQPANFFHAAGQWHKTFHSGDGGTITITAKDAVALHGSDVSITTSATGQGMAGNIEIDTARLTLDSSASVSSTSNSEFLGGNAGTITVKAGDSVKLLGNSSLTTEAKGAGGGKIDVSAGNEIYLFNGGITSSVKQGEGKGGDVITNSKYVIQNNGNITANAEEGDGGAIFIYTDTFIKSADSKVTATSRRGNDGTVKIEAPDTDLSSDLTILPGTFLNAAQWIKKPCAARAGEKVSRFVIKGRDAKALSFDDWLPSPLIWYEYSESSFKGSLK